MPYFPLKTKLSLLPYLLFLLLLFLFSCQPHESSLNPKQSPKTESTEKTSKTFANKTTTKEIPSQTNQEQLSAPIDKQKTSPNSNSEREKLEKSIHSAVHYLVQSCQPTGKFIYRINLNPKIKVKTKYNILRHAGAIFALASYYQKFPSKEVLKTLKNATEFLKEQALAPIPELEGLLGFWSRPELNGSNNPALLKLGGTGLSLVALISMEKIQPKTTPITTLQKLGNFLLYMQKEEGGFYSKYIPGHGKDKNWDSLYYPGEAALSLVMLFEIDKDLKWLQASAKAISYLAKSRENLKSVPPDHWALLATERLLFHYHLLEKPPLSRNQIIHHAMQICEKLASNDSTKEIELIQKLGLTFDYRTCSTATRLEGLLAGLAVLPPQYASLRKRMRKNIDAGIMFLIKAQIKKGKHQGGIPRAFATLPTTHFSYNKAFNQRATEIRIDYNQHTLSAMLQYHRLAFKNKKASK